MCDTDEMMVIEDGMLRKNGYCWGIGALNCISIVGIWYCVGSLLVCESLGKMDH
jgi:hypothetical protein